MVISQKYAHVLTITKKMRKQSKSHVRHDDPEIMSISHIHVLLLSSAISLIVSLTLPSWSPVLVLELPKGGVTLVNLQRQLATPIRTNLQTRYTESLSKTSNVLQHCKYRKKSSATECYTRTIFRATSYHCKLALQVDQCNITLMMASRLGASLCC